MPPAHVLPLTGKVGARKFPVQVRKINITQTSDFAVIRGELRDVIAF
jgi:hypothetical protein